MKREDFRKKLNWDRCVECGDCLAGCRYLDITREEAVGEIKKINRGLPSRALEGCVSCYACDAFCARQAHPYERLHYAWNDRYEREGLPARASFMMPGRRPNFRQDMSFAARERALHAAWSTPEPPSDTVLYPGCNIMSMPLLADGIIFERLPVWGGWDLCCGEMYFRMGLLDPVKRTAERLTGFYKGKKIKEMVFACPACYNMFTHVLPGQFGARFRFKTTFLTDWLEEEFDRGRLEAKKTLNREAVVHDSCHARVLGRDFMDRQRRFLERLGLSVRETPLNREQGLCCGMAAGCTSYSAWDLVSSTMRQLRTLDRAGGEEAAIYCAGCLLMLSCMRWMNPFGKKLVHSMEYVREALGEKVPRRNMARALSIIGGITVHSMPVYYSRKSFMV